MPRLNRNPTLPFPEETKKRFQELKKSLEDTVVDTIDKDIPFQAETDASNQVIVATLSQEGRPVSFWS